MISKVSTGDKLSRQTFEVSRTLDYFTEDELQKQIGQSIERWPESLLHELVDNAIDAAEDHDIQPVVGFKADAAGIEVSDNGSGIPESTIEGIVDFTKRVSSRAAYQSPTRGRQGNGLMTVAAMAFVLSGEDGRFIITANGKSHRFGFRVDPITQGIVVEHDTTRDRTSAGTTVRIEWPKTTDCEGDVEWPFGGMYPAHDGVFDRLHRLTRGYAIFNPHLEITLEWFGTAHRFKPIDAEWSHWKANQPTSPFWYDVDDFVRLVAANIGSNPQRLVSDFLGEFDGLARNAKRSAVLNAAGLKRAKLQNLMTDDSVDVDAVERLLAAMQAASKPVTPARLGQIGRANFERRLVDFGCIPETVAYKASKADGGGRPSVTEVAFGEVEDELASRTLITGANWAPGVDDYFRSMAPDLGAILAAQKATYDQPLFVAVHVAHPCLKYSDSGKTSLFVPSGDGKVSR